MKKISKVLSFILGASMAVGISGSINASANRSIETDIPFTTPDGAVLYNMDYEKGVFSYRYTKGNGLSADQFNHFRYNILDIKVKDDIDSFVKVSNYFSDIRGDFYYCNGCFPNFNVYDVYVKGDDPRTHASVEDKYEQLSKICSKLYEEGLIEEATLTPIKASRSSEYLLNGITCAGFYGKNIQMFQPVADELQAFIDQHTEYGKITLFSSPSDEDSSKYYIYIDLSEEILNDDEMPELLTDFDTYDKLTALCDEIRDKFGFEEDDVFITSMWDEKSESVSTTTINLLDPYICDIDGSGKADITDATAILTAYAESAAGLQKAAADDKMDVNGDGEVNIEDATYVLTYYAEAAAGLR